MKLIRSLFLGIILTFSIFTVSGQAASIPSPMTGDVLKLAKSGVGDDVLLAFVQNQKGLFRLSTDDILALKDAKVGSDVIRAMLNHDVAATPAAAPPPPAPAPAPVVVQAPTVYLDPDPTPPLEIVPMYPWAYPRPFYHHPPYHRRGGAFIWGW
jgi:hypothetical protein